MCDLTQMVYEVDAFELVCKKEDSRACAWRRRYLLVRVTCSVAVCCIVLQCVAVCCSVLQCVAVCCSVWQRKRDVSRACTRRCRYLPLVCVMWLVNMCDTCVTLILICVTHV